MAYRHQLTPHSPAGLRAAKKAKISGVRGKSRTTQHVYLSADARTALADYLEHERPRDTDDRLATALFLVCTVPTQLQGLRPGVSLLS